MWSLMEKPCISSTHSRPSPSNSMQDRVLDQRFGRDQLQMIARRHEKVFMASTGASGGGALSSFWTTGAGHGPEPSSAGRPCRFGRSPPGVKGRPQERPRSTTPFLIRME